MSVEADGGLAPAAQRQAKLPLAGHDAGRDRSAGGLDREGGPAAAHGDGDGRALGHRDGNVGDSLMAAGHAGRENRRMETELNEDKQQPRPNGDRIAELEAQVDERDETIRLLNEALSRALDELNALDEAA